jgi:hypothetical protein
MAARDKRAEYFSDACWAAGESSVSAQARKMDEIVVGINVLSPA